MISLSKKLKEKKTEENNNQRKRPLIRDTLLLKGLVIFYIYLYLFTFI
jgi:hypothetical protein